MPLGITINVITAAQVNTGNADGGDVSAKRSSGTSKVASVTASSNAHGSTDNESGATLPDSRAISTAPPTAQVTAIAATVRPDALLSPAMPTPPAMSSSTTPAPINA